MTTKNATNLVDQFNAMLTRGTMPLFEIEITVDGDTDYLLVNLTASESGLTFDFDTMDLPTHFSGEVEDHGGTFLLPWDACFDDLDSYIEQVNNELADGFLLPNDLLTH